MTYSFRTALSELWREKWINFLCTVAIATGLFIMSLAFLLVFNMHEAVEKLPERFSMMVFLKDGLSPEQIEEAVGAVRGKDGVASLRYISREDALKELRAAMKDSDFVLEGLDENPLPASLELALEESTVTERRVPALAREIVGIEGVDEVKYGARLLSVIQKARNYAEALGALFMGILAAAVVFVCYSTVKILFYRKKSEIETLKLLGATRWFIRFPFLIEGGLIGFAAGALSALSMLALYTFVYLKLAGPFPLVKALAVPAGILLYPPAAGLFIGVAGAAIAIGRLRF